MTLKNHPKFDKETVKASILEAHQAINAKWEEGDVKTVPEDIKTVQLPHFSCSEPFETRDKYVLGDFLQYHDREFLRNAYRGILGRPADLGSFDLYLEKIRSARLSKIEILGRLRFSKEGRRKATTVKGLMRPFIWQTLCHTPVIGYGLRFLYCLIKLPAKVQQMEEFASFTSARFADTYQYNQDLVARLEVEINQLLERNASLQACLNDRASYTLTPSDLSALETGMSLDLANVKEAFESNLSVTKQKLAQKIVRVTTELQGEISKKDQQSQQRYQSLMNSQDLLSDKFQHLSRRFADLGDARISAFYEAFEDKFRGSRDLIKQRLNIYLPYLHGLPQEGVTPQIVDLGCGRGEWLELLAENGFPAVGVDVAPSMIQVCKDFNLDVIENDIFTYLLQRPSESIAAITGFHIIEHLPFSVLFALLTEIVRTLQPGGVVIFETPNPENIIVGSRDFYLDPTHRNPLPSKLTAFLLEHFDFSDIEVVELNPAESDRLEVRSDIDERFNHYFYAAMDYGIIGRKKRDICES